MATIAIYAGKTSLMPGMIGDAKKAVKNLKEEFSTLKKKAMAVSAGICNLEDVISSISAAVQTQEDKADALESFREKTEEFIEDAVQTDEAVAEKVNQNKDNFYDKYSYLKPDCEKSKWEKFCEGCKKVAEWCKENWESIVKIVVAVVIIVALGIASVLTGGVLAVILAGAFWGALAGGLISGIMGGIMSMMNGGSFLEGFADGLLSGAISGAITGAAFAGLGVAGQALGKVVSCASKLGKAIKVVSKVTLVMSGIMDGFDTLAFGLSLFDPNNPLVQLNQKLHESTLYNVIQVGVNALAIFTGAATTTMKCFVAGTLVLTVAGLVAIEWVKAGDRVIATDPDTMQRAEKMVLETYVHETDEIVHLTINGEVITSTIDHPFFVQDAGFVGAGDLYIGDKLLDAEGNTLLVEDVKTEKLDAPVKVYNFKVDEFHTYYVGNQSVWIHNSCGTQHQMDGKVMRNGEPIEGVGGSYKSGGEPGCGKLDYQQQLDTHTEAKFLKDLQGKVKPGDHIEMTGSRNPCQPGCQPKIRDFVSENGVTATYNATDTGLQYNWKPNGDNSVIQTVIDTGNNATVSSHNYYRRPNGTWGRKSLL